jgi:pSer/pThr/pTyr-binding forkhead associated (FHA) protein
MGFETRIRELPEVTATPAGGRYVVLEVKSVNVTYSGPARFDLSVDVIRLGRADDNDVMLAHPTVSRQDARIVRAGDVFYLEDLNTANGSWLNEARVPLSSGYPLPAVTGYESAR